MKVLDINNFINTLRDSDAYIKTIYLNGGCYQFYLLLNLLFCGCEAYITADKKHIVTKYKGKYYDVEGEFTDEVVTKITNDERLLAETWGFSKDYKLLISECPFCEEPITI